MAVGAGILRVPKEAKKGEIVKVQMVITHPMEPGTRKDPQTGQIIPAYHLTKLEVLFNDKTVSVVDMGGGVSANPFIGLTLKVDESGIVKISYEDNKGGKWEKTAEIRVV
ncbi:MAG: thiosulfate oxidation carrier complex protein SoxZ [Hydrogenobacter thermophilus]|mgnify:FL=1|uniref:thiosulfate oxidation carrier complex protein SoxZ n=1 Tax=Hydrogenobacter thermophilus TaxID=940 RepID=UPI001C788174|nr:thiosulfate oxidation carrier complex protein SoxZ [Hydrogenobacter thermophilus]MCS7284197.1 thiosulfate oxidation carrier complex protein SoxZ [Hydrogenobacter thermophilus]QWK19023.1 MAG: thiosulfate oxidation carrier complex protein SoxZ [Hydrogenobacter thermophilus]